jgi:serine/threonine protein kinase
MPVPRGSGGRHAAHQPGAGVHQTAADATVTAASELQSLRPYRLGRELGRGGFGVVFEALHSVTGESVAIKRISLANVGPAELVDIQQEIELLKQLSHPNIVRYIDSVRTDAFLYIVLELVEKGSLSAAIKRFGNFDEQLTAVYIAQVLRGLEYLHDNGVIHRGASERCAEPLGLCPSLYARALNCACVQTSRAGTFSSRRMAS